MTRTARTACLLAALLVTDAHAAAAPNAPAAPDATPAPLPDAATLTKLAARLAPVDLTVDVAALPGNERAAVAELIAASKIMDALALRQVWAGNETRLLDLTRDRSPLAGGASHEAALLCRGRGRRDAPIALPPRRAPAGAHQIFDLMCPLRARITSTSARS